MPFAARSLRVQLPCGPITVVEAENIDAEIKARRYLRDMFSPVANDDCEGPPSHEPGGLDRLCKGSDPLDVRILVDASILPVLRRQLEAKLKEIEEAEAKLANTPQNDQ